MATAPTGTDLRGPENLIKYRDKTCARIEDLKLEDFPVQLRESDLRYLEKRGLHAEDPTLPGSSTSATSPRYVRTVRGR